MAQRVEQPPYTSYATIIATFAGGLAAAGAIARALRRDPQCHSALDFVVLGAASFKAAHTLSHDEVTSFIRQPFVKGEAQSGDEEPVESGGMEQAIGELVTWSRCAGTWPPPPRCDPGSGAALRPAAHVVTGRRRRERLPASRLRRTDV
jgi:hypothetical protein